MDADLPDLGPTSEARRAVDERGLTAVLFMIWGTSVLVLMPLLLTGASDSVRETLVQIAMARNETGALLRYVACGVVLLIISAAFAPIFVPDEAVGKLKSGPVEPTTR